MRPARTSNDNVIQFLNARQRADGKLIAIDRPFLGTQLGGDTLLIDAANFVEFDQASTPTPGTSGSGQTSATALGVTTDANKPSLGGRFASVYPLYDGTNRMLVSWAPCLVLNADGSVTIVISRGMTAHPNSLTTLDYPLGNLAFRWFLADEVPARPQVRLVKLSDAPTSVDAQC